MCSPVWRPAHGPDGLPSVTPWGGATRRCGHGRMPVDSPLPMALSSRRRRAPTSRRPRHTNIRVPEAAAPHGTHAPTRAHHTPPWVSLGARRRGQLLEGQLLQGSLVHRRDGGGSRRRGSGGIRRLRRRGRRWRQELERRCRRRGRVAARRAAVLGCEVGGAGTAPSLPPPPSAPARARRFAASIALRVALSCARSSLTCSLDSQAQRRERPERRLQERGDMLVGAEQLRGEVRRRRRRRGGGGGGGEARRREETTTTTTTTTTPI